MEKFETWYKKDKLHDAVITKIINNKNKVKFEIDSSKGYHVSNVKSITFNNAKIVKQSENNHDLLWYRDELEIMWDKSILTVYVQDFNNGLDNDELQISFENANIEFND